MCIRDRFLPERIPLLRRQPLRERGQIVALDGKTGKVVWSFQTFRHDICDYDLIGHPLLV